MSYKRNQINNDYAEIPKPCQFKSLSLSDNLVTQNENVDWLTEQGQLPSWSRLKLANCIGQSRRLSNSKEKNYDIEIPDRLLSLFGSTEHQTFCMHQLQNMENHHLLNNILALCTILKCDFRDWSESLIDTIATTATNQYPELLKNLSITDKSFQINHLNRLFNIRGDEYKAKVDQVATGYLYIRYGLDEFNLARALAWFFNIYQFGLIQCCNRTLVFGRTLDTNYSFFMYDCQSRGFPMFEDGKANSYILRTQHLQILLYCLMRTLNVSAQNVKFTIYNADIVVLDPLERKCLRKEAYKPIIATTKEFFEATENISSKNSINNGPTISSRSTNKSNKTSETQKSRKQITLDSNNMYYIIAIPKKSNILDKLASKQLLFSETYPKNFKKPSTESFKDVEINIHHINTRDDNEGNRESFPETIDLHSTASIETLIPEKTEETTNSKDLGVKIYLVEDSNSSNTTKDKIKVARRLKDFLIK